MKRKRLAAAVLTAGICVSLGGCTAMLERSYSSSSAHVDRPNTGGDSSGIRVENYRELVSAVLYLVSQGEEQGVIQFNNYAGEKDSDLARACLEVATQDPLGAYAVDYIKHETAQVISYDQAVLTLHYRRTVEQIRSVANVTGARAIRTELQGALANFAPEAVLRVAYFSEDEETIRGLIREAYYSTPSAALGLPQADMVLYPDSGRERILEITLTYPEEAEELREKKAELRQRAGEVKVSPDHSGQDQEEAAKLTLSRLWGEGTEDGRGARYDREGGSTAYAALVEGKADSQGMALAYALLCEGLEGMECRIVRGTLNGEERFWNEVRFSGGSGLYTDPGAFRELSAELFDRDSFAALGYFFPET